MLKILVKGDWKKTRESIAKLKNEYFYPEAEQFRKNAIRSLSGMTPVGKTGQTAASWEGKIKLAFDNEKLDLTITNTAHSSEAINIAKAIQYGHGTRNGGYVSPTPYIDTALEAAWIQLDEDINKKLQED